MDQSHWTDAERQAAWAQPLTNEAVVEAICALDGVAATDLYLRDGDEPEVYLAVAGGAEQRYLVFISTHDSEFVQAITPDAEIGAVELVVGGQTASYSLRELVSRSDAIAAALHFLQHRTPAETVVWTAL